MKKHNERNTKEIHFVFLHALEMVKIIWHIEIHPDSYYNDPKAALTSRGSH